MFVYFFSLKQFWNQIRFNILFFVKDAALFMMVVSVFKKKQ